MSQGEIDRVMANNHVCCKNGCIKKWKEHFDGLDTASKGESKARAITTVLRTALAGMDYVQRMVFHVGRLQPMGNAMMEVATQNGGKVQTGKS